uniref:V-type proton ATPase proteolipid subunit n=1 Tax=Romanomermis culicivorax TaxID=13658 RepID=A0A915JTN5_ROMCU
MVSKESVSDNAWDTSPIYSPLFGVLGSSLSMILTSLGAGYGTAKAGTSIATVAAWRPRLIMKSLIPVVMAGIIAIYGLVISVIITQSIFEAPRYSLYKSFCALGAGIAVGVSGLSAGYAIGIVGDVGVRGTAHQPKLFIGMVLILIFAEVLGLYGLIVALLFATKEG